MGAGQGVDVCPAAERSPWATDLEAVEHHMGLIDALPQVHQGPQGLFPRWNQGRERSSLLLPLLCALTIRCRN